MHNKNLKLVCAAFGLALSFTSVPLIAPMANVYAATETLTTDDGVSYTKSGDNITITGYSGTALKVDLVNSFSSIEGSITSIADKAFKGNEKITSVVIPNGCSSIGKDAFRGCTALKTVEIKQAGELVLGESVFYGCTSLTTVNWKDVTETAIPAAAFENTAISAIQLPEVTTSIGYEAFYGCKALTNIEIPASCSVITTSKSTVYHGAFESSGLKSITFNEEGKNAAAELTIGRYSFQFTDLENVELPARCTSVQQEAFYIADGGLDSITIHSNVTLVDKSLKAFTGTQNTVIYGCDQYTNAIKYAYDNNSWCKYQVPCSEIKVVAEPTKTRYTYGDLADLITGLQIEATYVNNADNTNTSAVLKKQDETSTEACNYASNLIVTGYNKDKVGPQTITVTYGKATATFKAYVRYDLSSQATVSLADISESRVYTGSGIEPTIVAKNENTTINAEWYEVSYKNNINATKEKEGQTTSTVDKTEMPTATLTAKNEDYVIGTTNYNFDIYAKNIKDEDVIASVTGSHVYSGDEVNLTADEISLTYNGEVVPFVIASFGNNIKATTASSKANCYISVDSDKTKNYTGNNKCVKYDIEPLSLESMLQDENLTINTGAELVYNGQKQQPTSVVLTRKSWIEGAADIKLSETNDYTIKGYKDNTNAGNATVTIAGTGNYTGTVNALYTIKPASIKNTNITVSPEKTYTGEVLMPDVKVVFGSGESAQSLVEDTDYIVSVTPTKASEDVTADPIAVGDYTVTIEGKGNFEGSTTEKYEIKPIVIDDATFTVDEEYAYTGKAICPEIEVKLGDTVLSAETDYDVTYEDNVEPGMATVTVTGKGGYAGTVTRTFRVLGKPLFVEGAEDNAVITAIPDQEYDCDGAEPNVEVKKGEVTLEKGTDYEVTYADNDKLGTATVTITGIDNYSGTLNAEFKIVKKDVANCDVQLEADSYTYTGEAITPTVKIAFVKGSEKLLKADTDYTVAYADNTKIGKATVTIEGKGNYTGEVEKTFDIKAIDLKDSAELVVDTADKTYTGEAISPEVTVKYGEASLEAEKDYTVAYENNVDAGTATVTVTGTGIYTGTLTAEYKILAKDITNCDVQLDPDNYTYTGEEVTPSIKIMFAKGSEKELTVETDYDLSYLDNTEIGKATVTITGKGNYTGSLQKTFAIKAIELKDCKVEVDTEDKAFSGKEYKPTVTVKHGEVTLTDKDYEVTYENNVNAGEATVTVNGKGHYAGQYTSTFKITQKGISGLDIALANIDTTATGQEIKPAVTVKDGNKNLTENVDYKVVYANNINAGTATVTITGIGNYSGKVDKTFEIKPAPTPAPSTEAPAQNVAQVKGDVITISTVIYQIVVPATDGTGEVAYKGLSDEEEEDATNIEIPDTVTINGVDYNVTSIKTGTFKNCKKLKKITIGKNVKSIDKQAFAGCKKLKNIVIKSTKLSKKTIKKNAFKGLKKGTTIKVPKKKYKEYTKLFRQKGLDKAVKIRK